MGLGYLWGFGVGFGLSGGRISLITNTRCLAIALA